MGVTSQDGVHDSVVDGVDGVDHGECCKGDDEGEGWVMVDNGGTPWVDNQLKVSNPQSTENFKPITSVKVATI